MRRYESLQAGRYCSFTETRTAPPRLKMCARWRSRSRDGGWRWWLAAGIPCPSNDPDGWRNCWTWSDPGVREISNRSVGERPECRVLHGLGRS